MIFYRFLQKKGVNRINTVNSSKRPINIKKEHHHFPNNGKELKLFTGLNCPKPGPTLPSEVAAPPIAD